ncbi:MAG: XrtV sorting system accessory protein [Phenylobacterium sp.]|uniref:XrtV sorting system accessory protein n=1 Tax=Phenylobacterium sp. TaxID=1871053 RepID=UPI003918E77B
MSTIYDWASMAIFAGLVVLFLHRSMAPGEPRDRIIHYLPPAIGCALANYVGNQGLGLLAGIIMLAVVAYIFHILKPFSQEH